MTYEVEIWILDVIPDSSIQLLTFLAKYTAQN